MKQYGGSGRGWGGESGSNEWHSVNVYTELSSWRMLLFLPWNLSVETGDDEHVFVRWAYFTNRLRNTTREEKFRLKLCGGEQWN